MANGPSPSPHVGFWLFSFHVGEEKRVGTKALKQLGQLLSCFLVKAEYCNRVNESTVRDSLADVVSGFILEKLR
ncbi:hypothetical protein CUMW_118040 [Citrus unshiu]|nr:hypothetical protein CUMW_118040 [Citrus unshiu]GAY49288.1 hypothetical protein CUMW_118040 [Citrus unshiu]